MIFHIALLVLALTSPHAWAKKEVRKPANSSPYKVLSIECKNEANDDLVAIGLAQLSEDIRDANVGTFGLTLYVKTGAKAVTQKSLQGSYTSVPGGLVLRTRWQGPEYSFIHLHPRERTQFPILGGKHICEIKGQFEQL